MRTIGRHYHGPSRNWTDLCDYCGSRWHRSDMTLDAEKQLRCPECDRVEGKTPLELSIEKAAAAEDVQPIKGKTREY